jgi:hypothetical protein
VQVAFAVLARRAGKHFRGLGSLEPRGKWWDPARAWVKKARPDDPYLPPVLKYRRYNADRDSEAVERMYSPAAVQAQILYPKEAPDRSWRGEMPEDGYYAGLVLSSETSPGLKAKPPSIGDQLVPTDYGRVTEAQYKALYKAGRIDRYGRVPAPRSLKRRVRQRNGNTRNVTIWALCREEVEALEKAHAQLVAEAEAARLQVQSGVDRQRVIEDVLGRKITTRQARKKYGAPADPWNHPEKGKCMNPIADCPEPIYADGRCRNCFEFRRTHHGQERPANLVNRQIRRANGS